MIILATPPRLSGEQSALVWLAILGTAAAIGGILYGLAWLDRKKGGRRGHGMGTRAGAGMLELQSLLEPGKRHLMEAKKQRKQAEGSGDDDDTAERGQL